jgi:hypothetical protein
MGFVEAIETRHSARKELHPTRAGFCPVLRTVSAQCDVKTPPRMKGGKVVLPLSPAPSPCVGASRLNTLPARLPPHHER